MSEEQKNDLNETEKPQLKSLTLNKNDFDELCKLAKEKPELLNLINLISLLHLSLDATKTNETKRFILLKLIKILVDFCGLDDNYFKILNKLAQNLVKNPSKTALYDNLTNSIDVKALDGFKEQLESDARFLGKKINSDYSSLINQLLTFIENKAFISYLKSDDIIFISKLLENCYKYEADTSINLFKISVRQYLSEALPSDLLLPLLPLFVTAENEIANLPQTHKVSFETEMAEIETKAEQKSAELRKKLNQQQIDFIKKAALNPPTLIDSTSESNAVDPSSHLKIENSNLQEGYYIIPSSRPQTLIGSIDPTIYRPGDYSGLCPYCFRENASKQPLASFGPIPSQKHATDDTHGYYRAPIWRLLLSHDSTFIDPVNQIETGVKAKSNIGPFPKIGKIIQFNRALESENNFPYGESLKKIAIETIHLPSGPLLKPFCDFTSANNNPYIKTIRQACLDSKNTFLHFTCEDGLEDSFWGAMVVATIRQLKISHEPIETLFETNYKKAANIRMISIDPELYLAHLNFTKFLEKELLFQYKKEIVSAVNELTNTRFERFEEFLNAYPEKKLTSVSKVVGFLGKKTKDINQGVTAYIKSYNSGEKNLSTVCKLHSQVNKLSLGKAAELEKIRESKKS